MSQGPTSDWDVDDAPRMPTKVRDLFVWTAPSHHERKYPREFFTTLAAICLLLSIILAFFQEWFAILVVWAAYFLFVVTTRIPATATEHKITTQGIVSMERSYLWVELGPFWFSERAGETILHLAHRNIFGQITMIIKKEDEDIIRDILAHYLPFIETYEKSVMEKVADWFGKKFPIEKAVLGEKKEPLPSLDQILADIRKEKEEVPSAPERN